MKPKKKQKMSSWDFFNMQLEFISGSASFTRNLGKEFSGYLASGDVLLLSGELGGGKTTFISGIAEGLGISGDLSSPSFTILNEYRTGKKSNDEQPKEHDR